MFTDVPDNVLPLPSGLKLCRLNSIIVQKRVIFTVNTTRPSVLSINNVTLRVIKSRMRLVGRGNLGDLAIDRRIIKVKLSPTTCHRGL
jgi:hypothetical protein